MDAAEMQAELERLRAENAKLKTKEKSGITLKVSEKGGVSLYGMGRFPVTLYKGTVALRLRKRSGDRGIHPQERIQIENEGLGR